MKKTKSGRGINSMPGRNQNCHLYLSCVGTCRVTGSTWMAGTLQFEKGPYGAARISASGDHLPGWIYFYL